jgi:hypothetical protein
MNNEITQQTLDLGLWMGRAQTFGLIANLCSAGEAESLKRIKESEAYKQAGLNWDQFCEQKVGLTPQSVNNLLRNLEEFGGNYFRLSQIVRVSPETFRQIAPAIEGETIEIDGDLVPIVPENGRRIREAVQQVRRDLQKSRKQKQDLEDKLADVGIEAVLDLEKRIDFCVDAFMDYFTSCRTRLERRIAERVAGRLQAQAEQLTANLDQIAILER